ncbi:hypothetical protein OPQ81_010372 [Rhizoctonia solani]|nr:hypothetical protein OPQ81_010372 [Rhizoctonia solani]
MADLARHSSHFNTLSDELIVQVLHFCRFNEILGFAITNKRHYNIISSSISLKLHIELDVHGLDIIKGSRKGDGSYSRLLDELVCYQDAWLNLDFEEPTKRTSNQVMSLWELREAVVLVKVNPDNPTYLEIMLCSTVTGLPHPLAQKPIFAVQVGFRIPGPGNQTFTLEVIDDILVTRIADIMNYRYEVIAWDWKSGNLLCRVGSNSGFADFSLLDSTYLVLFSVEADEVGPRLITISLYSMLPHAHDENKCSAYFYASEYPHARPVLTFEFPQLDDTYIVSSRVIMRSDPIPGRVTYTKSASFAHSAALTFSVILSLVQISNFDADEQPVHLRIFISAKSLFSYLPEFTGGEDTVVIPWSSWGTQATRWFICEEETNYWVYWTSGSRFVRVDETQDSPLHSLSIFDFHPPTVRRHALRDIYPPTEHPYSLYKETMKDNVLEGKGLTVPHPVISISDADTIPLFRDTIDSGTPTVVKKGFSVPVESRLPYRVVTRPKFVPSCEDWSIDGDHIVGMTRTHDATATPIFPIMSARPVTDSLDIELLTHISSCSINGQVATLSVGSTMKIASKFITGLHCYNSLRKSLSSTRFKFTPTISQLGAMRTRASQESLGL